MSGETSKYYAFISYSSKDTKWGRHLQRKLENYKMPTTLCRDHGWQRKPIRPVFFAPYDIQPGDLNEELKARLRASKNLIVICSPASAKSEWVGKEIEYFHSLGRTGNIYLFIVEGVPHSQDKKAECFNPVIDRLGIPEKLGVNIHEHVFRWAWLNRQRAYVQLVTKLLGVEFDSIWQRHKRRLAEKIAGWTALFLCVLTVLLGVWAYGQPVDVSVGLREASYVNPDLPPMKDAVVTMSLENEVKEETVGAFTERAVFVNIPKRFIGKEVSMSVRCGQFKNLDTAVLLMPEVTLNLYRDRDVYGKVSFQLWAPERGEAVPDCEVKVAGIPVRTDADGRVSLSIPLEQQRPFYLLEAEVPLASDTLFMPCRKNDVIEVR